MVRRAFEKIGYSTKFALLNAADFGVPQRRVRLFMIGTQEGPMPEFPAPTHHDGRGHAAGRSPWVSLREHLAKCPEPSEDEIVEPTDALANRLREIPDGSGLRSPGARERTRPGGHWGYRQGTFVADLDRPARTVTASPTQDWVRVGGTTRRLTERECAGLQGFPAAWVFCGGKSSRFRQIGNAVPARLGDVLGACICDALSRSPETVQPVSEPFPEAFSAAIAYTLREEKSNGPSRMSVRRLQAAGRVEQSRIKGTGSHDRRRSHR